MYVQADVQRNVIHLQQAGARRLVHPMAGLDLYSNYFMKSVNESKGATIKIL